ncbi:MAG: hypothetical protein IKD69_15645 [Solobacterium sp.]|nr:hypothetical protein [Solobacterium sp.]
MNRQKFLQALHTLDVDTLLQVSPAAMAMKGYDQQHPYHCYDLLDHTMETVKAVDPNGLTAQEYDELLTAAFFHDIGKPDAMEIRYDRYGNARRIYPGHPRLSMRIAIPILRDLGFAEEEISRIAFYIDAHDTFMKFRLENAESTRLLINEKNVQRVISRSGRSIHDFTVLMHLCAADAAAHAEIIRDPDGNIVDTREQIINRMMRIQQICKSLEKNS